MDFTSDNINTDSQVVQNTHSLNKSSISHTKDIQDSPRSSSKRNKKLKTAHSSNIDQSSFPIIRQGQFTDTSFHFQTNTSKANSELEEEQDEEDEDVKQLELINLKEVKLKLLGQRQALIREVETLKTQYGTLLTDRATHSVLNQNEDNIYEKLFSIRLEWQMSRKTGLKPSPEIVKKSEIDTSVEQKLLYVSPLGQLEEEVQHTSDYNPLVNISERQKYLEEQYPLITIIKCEHNKNDLTATIDIDIDGFRYDIHLSQNSLNYCCKIEGDFDALNLKTKKSKDNLHNIIKNCEDTGNLAKTIEMLYSIVDSKNSRKEYKTQTMKKFIQYYKSASNSLDSWIVLDGFYPNKTQVRVVWDVEVESRGNVQNVISATTNSMNDNSNLHMFIKKYGLLIGIHKYLANVLQIIE